MQPAEPICLKDESKFEKLFDDCWEDDSLPTADCDRKGSMVMSFTSGPNFGNSSLLDSSFHYLEQPEEETINVDDVLNHENSSPTTQTIFDDNEMVSYYSGEATSSVPEIKPIISREGLRKARKTPCATKAKLNSGPRRNKKTDEQVEYLTQLYVRLGGKWDGSCRKEAIAATGLSRIQIYKWFFDRQLQEKAKLKASRSRASSFDDSVAPEESTES